MSGLILPRFLNGPIRVQIFPEVASSNQLLGPALALAGSVADRIYIIN
jgi:hypothetical protein